MKGFFDEILDFNTCIVQTDGLLYQSMIHLCISSIYGRVAFSNKTPYMANVGRLLVARLRCHLAIICCIYRSMGF